MANLKWEDLPPEIQKIMLEEQVNQNNSKDSNVFKKEILECKSGGGFDWCLSTQGNDFWEEILLRNNINHFYTLYPKEFQSTKDYFKKGDYIVTLVDAGSCGKINYCSKQKVNDIYLKPCIDTKGHTDNGNRIFDIKDKSNTKWRYATSEEATEYERIGKPYDVTTLNKPQFIVGKWYKFFWTFSNEEVIIKVSSVNIDSVSSSFRIYLKNNDINHDYEDLYNFREINNITEITDLSEIQPYLPEGHPDNLVNKTEPHEIHNKSLVGRYLKAVTNNPNRTFVKKGDYVKIVSGPDTTYKSRVTIEGKESFLAVFDDPNLWELMPEGFEPKSEEEFVLPKKWCIKTTKENIKYLNDYLKHNSHKYKNYLASWMVGVGDYFHSESPHSNSFCHSKDDIATGFKEITFEQFKEHVFKKMYQKGSFITVHKNTVYNENKSDDRITYSESIQKEPTLYIKSKQNLLYTENFKTNELSLPTLIKPKKSLLINL